MNLAPVRVEQAEPERRPCLSLEHRSRPVVMLACTSDLGLPWGIGLSVPLYGCGVVSLVDRLSVARAIGETRQNNMAAESPRLPACGRHRTITRREIG
jgi:hypothetical protein